MRITSGIDGRTRKCISIRTNFRIADSVGGVTNCAPRRYPALYPALAYSDAIK